MITPATSPPDQKTGPAPTRRGMLLAAGTGAMALGAGVGWWRSRVDDSIASPVEGFWSLQFESPRGTLLRMSDLRGKPLLVNFWATWCPPCIEELPLIEAFYKKNKPIGWQVLGLAVDQPSAVGKFLERTPLSFGIGMAGLNGTELSKSMGNVSGSLPFSVVIGEKGNISARKLGRLSEADLQTWAELR